jgi:biotin operon repressor
MSFTAMAWASKQKVKTSTQKLVLLMLANYADDEDKCWPSKQTLADMCCMSKAAICSNISKLQEAGFLKVDKREGTSSIIRLNMGVHHEDSGCPPSGQGVSIRKTGGVHHVDTNLSMNQSNETINEEYISAQSDFDEFWAAYPKRPSNPKAEAKKKYMIARKRGVSRETLLTAVNKYAQRRAGEDPKFTAQACTWLHQRRWEDDDDPVLPDVNINSIVEVYPAKIVDTEAAKQALAAEVMRGSTVDEIRDCAVKYARHIKELRADGLDAPVTAMENWLRWGKWKEMKNYELVRVGPDRRLTIRQLKK